MTYASSTTLTIDTLLYRNHHASKLWQDLFRFDIILQGKRERSVSDVLSIRILDDMKRSQQRKRVVYSETDFLTIARRYTPAESRFRDTGGLSPGLHIITIPLATTSMVALDMPSVVLLIVLASGIEEDDSSTKRSVKTCPDVTLDSHLWEARSSKMR
jgi:hypothetical protein